MRVAAARSTETGIQSHDPAVLAINVHGAWLKRTRSGLRYRRESVRVVQIERISPAPITRKQNGTQGLPQARFRAHLGNEAPNQEAQRRQLNSSPKEEILDI